jgi:hypothetical protein
MDDIPALFPFIDADDELLKSLGRATMDFNALKQELSEFISRLIDAKDPHPAFVAVCELSFKTKLGVLMSEYELKVKLNSKREQLRHLLGICGNIDKARNHYMHSFFYSDSSNSEKNKTQNRVRRLKPKSYITKGFLLSPALITPKELNDFSNRIRSIGIQLLAMDSEYSIAKQSQYEHEKSQTTKT